MTMTAADMHRINALSADEESAITNTPELEEKKRRLSEAIAHLICVGKGAPRKEESRG